MDLPCAWIKSTPIEFISIKFPHTEFITLIDNETIAIDDINRYRISADKMTSESISIEQIQDAIIEEFGCFAQWMDKYEYLIDLGKQLPLIDAAHKIEANLIRGCQSQVWVRAQFRDGRMRLTADSDAIITKGIIALLIRVLGEQKPADIAAAELYFIDAIGLREHLSSTRANGLLSMVNTLQATAKEFNKAH